MAIGPGNQCRINYYHYVSNNERLLSIRRFYLRRGLSFLHGFYGNRNTELEATRALKHPRRTVLPPSERDGDSVYAQSSTVDEF